MFNLKRKGRVGVAKKRRRPGRHSNQSTYQKMVQVAKRAKRNEENIPQISFMDNLKDRWRGFKYLTMTKIFKRTFMIGLSVFLFVAGGVNVQRTRLAKIGRASCRARGGVGEG